jgi:hypothetical protein
VKVSPVVWTSFVEAGGGIAIFNIKNNVFFSYKMLQFLVIKTLDPDPELDLDLDLDPY